jgi:hypothetical protein
MTVALEGVEKPKVAGFVDSGYNRKNRARIEQDEKELEELLTGKTPEEESKKEEEVEAPKEEPKLSKEEESFKKRYGDLRRHMAEKEKEWEAKFESLKNQTPSTIIPPKSDEDLEDWVKKYPDIAGIVSALVEKQLEGTKESVRELDNLRWDAKRERAEAEVRKAHSDWDSLKEDDDFLDWVDLQPKLVQDALYDQLEDSRAVIRVLDLYKADKGLTKQAFKEDERKAAGFVKATSKTAVDKDEGGFTFSESQVAKMSDKEYEKNEAKILEAMRSGKFNYDLSGGAR